MLHGPKFRNLSRAVLLAIVVSGGICALGTAREPTRPAGATATPATAWQNLLRARRDVFEVAADTGDELFWDGFELCGDGVVDDASEQCDRSDLNGATCQTQRFSSGTLTCDRKCQYDTSQCSGACPTLCNSDADCGSCGPCVPFGPGTSICLN